MEKNSTRYSVKIANSSRELTKKERVALKDTSNAIRLDEACEGAKLVIMPTGYVVLVIENEASEDKTYENYIIFDKGGNKYVTGSETFFNTFMEIWDEMYDGDDTEEFEIEIYKRDSKNYKGKQFITCSIVA